MPEIKKAIDTVEKYLPSKVKKFGLNPNSPKTKRKANERWKFRCGSCLKNRLKCEFKALAKEQKAVLKECLEDHAYNCGFTSCRQFGIAQTELNFGNNSVKTNHKIKCDDFIEQHAEHIFFFRLCLLRQSKL